jgi:hypothetical protein
MNWQPIESAPKNRRILLADDYFVGEGYWYEPSADGPDEMGNDGGFADMHHTYFRFPRSFGAEEYRDPKGLQPTHWMPMPSPPDTQPKEPQS